MRLKFALVGFAALFVAIAITFTSGKSEAQPAPPGGGPPEFRVLILQGNVSVGSQPGTAGWKLIARIGNYQSEPVTIGQPTEGRYVGLTVGPQHNVEGQNIEFWLEGQVRAIETTVFGPTTATGSYCGGCGWSLPITRTVDLIFPTAPQPTPTPTFTPTATPITLQPSSFSGRVFAGNGPPPNGTAIFAVVDDYVSAYGEVLDGKYQLVVSPVHLKYLDKTVEFFLEYNSVVYKAQQTAAMAGGIFKEDMNLTFQSLPTPAPAASSTPPPATSSPTPAATATPLPPTPNTSATVAAAVSTVVAGYDGTVQARTQSLDATALALGATATSVTKEGATLRAELLAALAESRLPPQSTELTRTVTVEELFESLDRFRETAVAFSLQEQAFVATRTAVASDTSFEATAAANYLAKHPEAIKSGSCSAQVPGAVSGGMLSLLLVPGGLAAWVRFRHKIGLNDR